MDLNVSKEAKYGGTEEIKKCEFPGCGINFFGRGASKYCLEHRDKKYWNEKYSKEIIDNNNQVITHAYKIRQTKTCKCELSGCDETFNILILPKVYIYPKYCEKHRNEFKRETFLKNYSISSSSILF